MENPKNPPPDLDAALGVRELRRRFLEHTRAAYALLPELEQPRILDIGCGAGSVTAELARLSGGDVTGIDTDETALAEARCVVADAGLGERVTLMKGALFDDRFQKRSFEVLWEEGVLHLLDPEKSLPVCHRLLEPGGFLVMHETVDWFEGITADLPLHGFALANKHLLPKRCWWTDYFEPLERRIRAFREAHGSGASAEALALYERQIAMVKSDPERFDCGFYVLKKHPGSVGLGV
jgi:SAM-dependent methyltransferase